MNKLVKRKHVKHKIKDTVFTNLFRIPKYKLELYKSLNPKDKIVTIKDIKTITLETILTNNVYNDLGLLVGNRIIFLLEAQSTWSINILVREFIYLANTYKNYFEERKINLYSTKKVVLPMPELYVVYTGDKKLSKKEISLNEEFFNNESPIDIKVKIITLKEKNNNILMQYIKFSKIVDTNIKAKNKKTIKRIIDECIKKDILREYLQEHRKEVTDMLSVLYDQDFVTECYEKELYDEGMQQGMQQGIEQGIEKGKAEGITYAIVNLVKKGLLGITEASKELNVSERAIRKMCQGNVPLT